MRHSNGAPAFNANTKAFKTTRSVTDTIVVTEKVIATWVIPGFQRAVKDNRKVQEIGKLIAETGVIPGVITLGVLDDVVYRLDCQHRLMAFSKSGLREAYVDARYLYCKSMADMAREFVHLNTPIARLQPNDVLRGMTETNVALKSIRARCPFVGYDFIRRGERAPVLGMSQALRAWYGSKPDTPVSHAPNAVDIATWFENAADAEPEKLADFLLIANQAWGSHREYHVLWNALNLTLSMWMYRRLVIRAYSAKTPKVGVLLFRACLVALTGDRIYLDWLRSARKLDDRDRVPGYDKMKKIFAGVIQAEIKSKPLLPHPSWMGSK